MIIKGTPPNIDAIQDRFPAVAELMDRVVFTYAPDIYAPVETLPPDLRAHEEVHIKQQGDDPSSWWERYLTEDDFRLEQELEAYAVQLHMWKSSGNSKFKKAKDMFVKDLAGPMYDLPITYQDAENKLRRYEKLIT